MALFTLGGVAVCTYITYCSHKVTVGGTESSIYDYRHTRPPCSVHIRSGDIDPPYEMDLGLGPKPSVVASRREKAGDPAVDKPCTNGGRPHG